MNALTTMNHTPRSVFLLLTVPVTFLAIGGRGWPQANRGEPFVFENEAGRTMPYRLFTPADADVGDREFPLVVFLHGAGERGRDNTAQVRVHINGLIDATQSEEYASFLLAPQLPSGASWNMDGRNDLAINIIRSLQDTLPIDEQRVYVTGLSLGGNGSFNYITRFPEMFAGAVPMSGWGTPATAGQITEIPIWMFHGDRDSTVPPSGSRDMYEAIRDAGGAPLLTEIVGGSHVIWSPIYGDAARNRFGLYPWLFSQRKGVETSVEELIPFGAEWKYLDDGSDPGTAWQSIDFDDSSWSTGPAELGFGDSDESTVLRCGPQAPDCSSERYATFYFRREFEVEEPERISSVMAQIIRDDGVAVYLNGTEVFREDNLRSATAFDTFARSSSLDNGLIAFRIDPELLDRTNLLAVEVREGRTNTRRPDLSFDLDLSVVVVPEPSAFWLLALGVLCCLRRGRRVN